MTKVKQVKPTKPLKKLFIVESPNKTRTVKKYLPSDFEVAASVGHCYQLPRKDYCDFKNDYKLNFEPDPKKRDALKNIEELAKDCDEIYLATDMDTEGSSIAWNLYEHLLKKFKKKTYFRVNLKEITATGIKSALAACYPITDPKEYCIVQSAFLRRIEDRLTGFSLSPLAFAYVQQGTSAGRVQSPALRIVVERQREIDAFVPEVYYDIYADVFPTGTTDVFTTKYTGTVNDEKIATAVVASCVGKVPKITNITKKQTKGKPPEPFITKTMLTSASTILGWKTEKTSSIAQLLFQGGHITYIRCDNTVISDEGRQMLLAYTTTTYPSAYHVKAIPTYDNPKAKLEHECIRPTSLTTIPMFSNADEKKLYELIRKRFIAAGLPPALYDSTSVEVSIGPHEFKVSGSTLTFDGYLKEWNYHQKDDTVLPVLDTTTALSLRDCHHERKETKPPPRYKDTTLLEALDKMGIGKPSTYNSIIQLLDSRGYVTYEKQQLAPTDLGYRLNDFLMKYFSDVIDFDFTARVEHDQEEVMQGKLAYVDAVTLFHTKLKGTVKVAQTKMKEDKKDDENTSHLCPKCKAQFLLKKLNKKDSKFFYSCSGYLDKSCMATFAIAEDGSPSEQEKTVEVLCKCPRNGCDGDLTKRMNRKTNEVFYACTNWPADKGGCKVSADAVGTIRQPPVLQIVKKCEKCKKGSMVIRTSKKGDQFLGCNNYPKCRSTEKYPVESK